MRDYLRESRSPLSAPEAVDRAIKLWIANERANAMPAQGYQWKQLFLPQGTRVRLRSNEMWHTAQVEGDELIYSGSAVSPHQMVQQAVGDGRNAWRDLWIRMPGQQDWSNAAVLRARLLKSAPTKPSTPADAMATAAKAMSDALMTALTLVEHANHQSRNTLERRLPRYRRDTDQMDDID
ncbi:MAG: hypothetical protein ABW069_16745 [Duganella sp.]